MSRGHTHCEGYGSAESPPTRFAQPRQGLLSASSRDGPSASVPSQGHLTSQPGHLGNRPPKKGIPRPPDRLKHLSGAAGVEMFKGGSFGTVAVFAQHLVRKRALLWVGSGLLGEILAPGRCP